MNLTLHNNLPKVDDHIHPTLDDYCSFCSLYKKSVSFSSNFGGISHVRIKLPKVEEIGPSFSSLLEAEHTSEIEERCSYIASPSHFYVQNITRYGYMLRVATCSYGPSTCEQSHIHLTPTVRHHLNWSNNFVKVSACI